MGFFSALVGGVVGFLVGGPVGAIIGAGIGATKVGEKVVDTVMNFAMQAFMPSIPDMGSAAEQAQREQGVLIQRQGSTQQIPVVYGYRKVGAAVTFAETGSTSNKYLYVAYVLCEGPIEGLREVYIDDWQLPVDQVGALNAGGLVTVNADRYKDRVQLQFFPGVYFGRENGQTPEMLTAFTGLLVNIGIFAEAPSFSPDMVYNGLAVIFARYEWREIKTQADADANPFTGNIPKLNAGILGKRVASLLVDSTETQEYDTNPVRYSTNPAECLLDYLRNPRYGKGLVNNDIDWPTFKAAARKCNQTVTYLATNNIQGPILTLNMVVNTDSTLMSNVKVMLQNFRAYMPYVQGKYKLRIEDAGNETDILSGAATIVQTLTKDDIVSDVTFTGIDRSSKYNVVVVTYVDPDQKFSTQSVIYPETEAERQVYINRDGGRENKYEVTLSGITNYAIAKDFARLIFNKQRRQESCVFTATSRSLELEPGDCIRINSNILNFGTDPWRVISVKINNDMTVDLGCVRNPDDIYPYARVGEEDVVLPTYVPKGSIIYFPGSFNANPLGLVPPINAVFPVTITPVITNPPATNPRAPEFDNPGPITVDPTTPPTVPLNPINVVPTPPPPPPPFNAVLGLKSSKAISLGTGNYNFNIIFTQPQDGLYSYSIVWWRYNRFSPWTEVRLDTLPGAGGEIPWTLNNLGFGQYEYYVRSFATDGRPSGFAFKGQIAFPQNVADLNPTLSGIAGGGAIQVTSAWTVPDAVIATPRYDDDIDFFELRPKLDNGAPFATRKMRVVMNQITSTISKSPNFLLKGVRVYYKFSGDTYYDYEDFNFAGVQNYAPGTQVAFDLTGDFGAAGSGNALSNYDFVIRLTYTDGTAALKQLGPSRANVETFTGLNNFVAVGTGGGGNATTDQVVNRIQSQLIPTGFSLKTVDENPNKAYSSGAALIPNIADIRSNNTQPILTFTFNAPLNTKWRGYKIRYRPVVPGTNQQFYELNSGFTVVSGQVTVSLNGGAFSLNNSFDWVVTAQYLDTASSSVKDADTSLVCRASIQANLGSYYNVAPGLLNTVMAFQQQETTTALNSLRTAFPALPTPDPKAWIKKTVQPADYSNQATQLYGNGGGPPDGYRPAAGQPFKLNGYYQLKFQMPNDTFDALVIHRRVWDKNGAAKSTITNTAKYNGLGIWEKVLVTRASMTKGSDGFYTVNVRGPIDPGVFNPAYQVTAGNNLIKSQYGAGFYPDTSNSLKQTGVYPYYGAGNTTWSYASNTTWAEFLFSIKDAGVEQTRAIRLTDFYTPALAADGFKTQTDGFLGTGNVRKDDIVTIADFNTFEAGYSRNINEAITATIALDKLQMGVRQQNAGAFLSPNIRQTPNITSFDATSITIVVQQPTTGDTVY